jgi:energy-coupling factor transport system permease protein
MVLDPRTKLVIIICISSLALFYNNPGKLLLLLAGTIILLFIFRVDLVGVLKYLRRFLVLLLLLFVVQCIFSPGGETLLAVGPLRLITSNGLAAGASVVSRLGVVIASAALLTTTSPRDFILGLVQWKIPYEIAFMVSVAIRFLPVFRDEMKNVITAVQLRGVELSKVPWGQKIGLYRSLFFPVAYRAVLKAQQLSIAMEARGFRAYPRRTYLRRLHLSFTDYTLMLFFPVLTILLISCQLFKLSLD